MSSSRQPTLSAIAWPNPGKVSRKRPATFHRNIQPEQVSRRHGAGDNYKGNPQAGNPLIARTLYYSKDMGSLAAGLKRIHKACDVAGCKVEFLEIIMASQFASIAAATKVGKHDERQFWRPMRSLAPDALVGSHELKMAILK
jgi:hypothetical protein